MNTSNVKLGHTQNCYTDPNICKAIFLPVQLLSPHFLKVRNVGRLTYRLNFYRKIIHLNKALTCTDLDTLNNIVASAQEKAETYKYQRNYTILSEDDIM